MPAVGASLNNKWAPCIDTSIVIAGTNTLRDVQELVWAPTSRCDIGVKSSRKSGARQVGSALVGCDATPQPILRCAWQVHRLSGAALLNGSRYLKHH